MFYVAAKLNLVFFHIPYKVIPVTEEAEDTLCAVVASNFHKTSVCFNVYPEKRIPATHKAVLAAQGIARKLAPVFDLARLLPGKAR